MRFEMLLDTVPPSPDSLWTRSFATHFARLNPGCTQEVAVESAVCAYASTWLLEGSEAAGLWHAAVQSHLRDTAAR